MELGRIETEHLIGTRIQQDDLGVLYRMYTNEEVMYTLGGTKLFREAKESHAQMYDHWEKNEFGVYIFRDKQTEEFVGRGGLKKLHLEGRDEVEVMFAVMPKYWGKGLAVEIAKKSIEVAFEYINLDNVIAFTTTDNKRSQRVMEKAGLKQERLFTYHDLPHTLYRIKRR